MLKLGHNVEAGNKIALLCICLDALSKHCPSRSLSANPAHPILCVPVYLCICFVALSIYIIYWSSECLCIFIFGYLCICIIFTWSLSIYTASLCKSCPSHYWPFAQTLGTLTTLGRVLSLQLHRIVMLSCPHIILLCFFPMH